MNLAGILVVLPLAAFALSFAVFRAKGSGWRSAAIDAATVWGVAVVVFTEGLGAFHQLTVVGLSLAWGGADVLAAAYLYRTARRSGPTPIRARDSGLLSRALAQLRDVEDPALIALVVILIGLVGLTAIVCPPNTWDAMEYHMPRIVHWLQNQSVNFYATNETKQLYMAPWSEYAMLQLHALSGGDRLDNLVQWFGLVGSILCVTLIAQLLGAGYRGQVLAGVICATIPQGLLEASGAKNDVTVAFWLVVLTYYLFSLKSELTWWRSLAVGSALGLACLTKGTAWVLAPPILFVAVAIWFWRERRRIDGFLVLVGITLLALNAGYMLRNYRLYGAPLGPTALAPPKGFKVSNNRVSAGVVVSNALRNAALHMGTPSAALNSQIEAGIDRIIRATGEDPNDPDSTWDLTVFHVPGMSRHEATAGNPLHLVLILLTLAILPFVWRRRQLGMALALSISLTGAFLLFCAGLKWQPWNTRLHFALFVIWSPVVGAVLDRTLPRVAAALLCATLVLAATPMVLENQIRPLVGGELSIFNQPRSALYFAEDRALLDSYHAAVEFAKKQPCKDIGLDTAVGPRFEYPLLALFGVLNGQKGVRQVQVTDRSKIYSTDQAGPEPCVVLCPNCETVQYKADAYAATGKPLRTFGDVLVMTNGTATGLAAGSATATAKSCSVGFVGWYEPARDGVDWSRWSSGRGQLRVTSDRSVDGFIRGQLISIREPNKVRVSVNGETKAELPVGSQGFGQFGPIPLHLRAGENVIEFSSDNPAIKIPTDPRMLAIAIRDAIIRVPDSAPCALEQ